jgi:soluble lytic murein transglycosylase-like protein
MKGFLYLIGLSIFALPLFAGGESVVLSNGFRLHADRHEIVSDPERGDQIRLYSADGVTELAVASVSGFEADLLPDPGAPAPAAAKPAVQQPSAPPKPADLASAAAKKFNLPESFVTSVMRTESGFRADAVSPKGATGLMQLMPETARQLGVDPKNPQQNSEGGAAYLRSLLALYENRPDQVLLALAAYNAGPAAVERWHGVPPYRETREYILRVLKGWGLDQSVKSLKPHSDTSGE